MRIFLYPAILTPDTQQRGFVVTFPDVLGLTSIGRATITALALNRERVIAIRAADSAVGRHPPVGDPLEPVPPSS